MLAGYLRKNGVPYSDKAVLTEFYDPIREPDGDMWMIVTTVVEDPEYLENPLILTAQFRKQADGRRMGADALLGQMVIEPLRRRNMTLCNDQNYDSMAQCDLLATWRFPRSRSSISPGRGRPETMAMR